MAFKSLHNQSDISVEGIDQADLLAALYNAARPSGIGGVPIYDPTPMTSGQARLLIATEGTSFVCKNGRHLYVDVSSPITPDTYENCNGKGSVSIIVDELRRGKGPNSPKIAEMHRIGVHEAGEMLCKVQPRCGMHVWSQFLLRFPQFSKETNCPKSK